MLGPRDPATTALINAAFMHAVYLAERVRMARLAGLLPVPSLDPLALRLLRLVPSEATPDQELYEALAEATLPLE